jgi:hypothetical protein
LIIDPMGGGVEEGLERELWLIRMGGVSGKSGIRERSAGAFRNVAE